MLNFCLILIVSSQQHGRASLLYLCDVWKSDHIGHQTDNCDEELSSTPKGSGKFIHQSSDEAFNSAELKDRIIETVLSIKCDYVQYLHLPAYLYRKYVLIYIFHSNIEGCEHFAKYIVFRRSFICVVWLTDDDKWQRIAVCTKPWDKNTNVIFWMTKHPLLGGHFGNSSDMQKWCCYDI